MSAPALRSFFGVQKLAVRSYDKFYQVPLDCQGCCCPTAALRGTTAAAPPTSLLGLTTPYLIAARSCPPFKTSGQHLYTSSQQCEHDLFRLQMKKNLEREPTYIYQNFNFLRPGIVCTSSSPHSPSSRAPAPARALPPFSLLLSHSLSPGSWSQVQRRR